MAQPHRALVVEDDPDQRALLVYALEQTGCEVQAAETGAEAIDVARRQQPDLVTLDLSLPDMDGIDVCRAIRGFSDAYILMVTGRDAEIDRLLGLELGADDYLAKPFSPRELRARASALLRRPRASSAPAPAPTSGTEQVLGPGLVLVPDRGQVRYEGEPVPCTPPEAELLGAMAARPGVTWDRGELVREVWQRDFIESDFLVDMHVASLRRKLRKATGRDWIRTVAGTGYAFEPSPDLSRR